MDTDTQAQTMEATENGLSAAERQAASREDAVRASEARYRALMDAIDEGFCIIEVLFEGTRAVDYRFLEANPAFVEQTGLADAVGRTMRELAPAHEEHWFEAYGRVALSGEAVRFEAPAQALGRWYDVYAFRIGDPAERRVAVLFADVAPRKHAETALRESEARFRALATASGEALYRMSPDWSEMHQLDGRGFVSDTTEASDGWMERYIHPNDQAQVTAAIQEAVRSKRAFELKHRVVRADGTLGWTSSRAVPLFDVAGEITEWIGAASDVTAHRGAEEELRESEARYRALYREMDQAYAVVEVIADETGRWTDFRFLEVNPAFTTHTSMPYPVGRTATELLGTPNPKWAEVYGRVAETGESVRFEEPENTLGRVFDLNVFRLGGPGSRRVAVLFSDVTERKRGEARRAFLLELSDALGPLAGSDDHQTDACRLLCEHLDIQRVDYAELEADEYIIRSSYATEAASIANAKPVAVFSPPLIEEARRTGAVGIEDVATDPRLEDHERASYARAGIAATASVMLRNRDRWVASLAAHSTTPRQWTPEMLSIVQETAERIRAASERERAEGELRETQRRLDEALATARMAYWQRDPTTGRIVASRWMEELFGVQPDERFETSAERLALLHPDDRERYRTLMERADARGEGWRVDFRIVRPRDGQVASLEEIARVAVDPQTGLLRTTGFVWDISDRKRSEASAALERATSDRDALLRQLLEAEEAERRRLARELHDETGQHLTALGLGLLALSNVAPAGSEVDRRAAELHALVNTMGQKLHAVAVRLRPKALDDFGLEAALAAYAEEWSRQTEIPVDVHVPADPERLPSGVESALYRVVQEALTNVSRHSGAKRVSIVVERDNGHVVAVVEDDGRGFDPDGVASPPDRVPGFGLLGMRERVTLLGGTVEVESAVGAGATIFVRIPIRTEGKPSDRERNRRAWSEGGDV